MAGIAWHSGNYCCLICCLLTAGRGWTHGGRYLYVRAMRLFGLRLWRGSATFPVTGEHLSFASMRATFLVSILVIVIPDYAKKMT